MSYQDDLFGYFQNAYQNCEIKKINKDSNIDISLTDIHTHKNIHLNFNIKQKSVGIRLHLGISKEITKQTQQIPSLLSADAGNIGMHRYESRSLPIHKHQTRSAMFGPKARKLSTN